MTESFQHLLEPCGIAAGLQANDDFSLELGIEGADVVLLIMQVTLVNLTISRIAVADGLHAGMKVVQHRFCKIAEPVAE